MANQITGKVLHIYPSETIVGKNGNNITKRAILVDCTRLDPYTGERSYENTPLLEFTGEQCNELNNFHQGQIVTISFDVQGSKYINRDGVENIFTRVRPYKIELRQRQAAPVQPQQPQQPMMQQPIQQPMQYQPQQPQQPYYPKGAGECPF